MEPDDQCTDSSMSWESSSGTSGHGKTASADLKLLWNSRRLDSEELISILLKMRITCWFFHRLIAFRAHINSSRVAVPYNDRMQYMYVYKHLDVY